MRWTAHINNSTRCWFLKEENVEEILTLETIKICPVNIHFMNGYTLWLGPTKDLSEENVLNDWHPVAFRSHLWSVCADTSWHQHYLSKCPIDFLFLCIWKHSSKQINPTQQRHRFPFGSHSLFHEVSNWIQWTKIAFHAIDMFVLWFQYDFIANLFTSFHIPACHVHVSFPNSQLFCRFKTDSTRCARDYDTFIGRFDWILEFFALHSVPKSNKRSK